jgi:hypothetical protein
VGQSSGCGGRLAYLPVKHRHVTAEHSHAGPFSNNLQWEGKVLCSLAVAHFRVLPEVGALLFIWLRYILCGMPSLMISSSNQFGDVSWCDAMHVDLEKLSVNFGESRRTTTRNALFYR